MLDDRGNGLIGIGLAGDGQTDVVHGPQNGVARLEGGVALLEIVGQPIDPSKGIPGTNTNDRADGHNHRQNVERERQEGICGRVAENFDGTDEEDGGDYDEPATTAIHPRLRVRRATFRLWLGQRTHPFGEHYAPNLDRLTRTGAPVSTYGTERRPDAEVG